MIMAVCHTEERGWTDIEDLSRISDLRAQAGNVLWADADVSTLSQEDLGLIAEEFDLHPLAVEDAIHTRQRPKLEPYEKHLFMVLDELDEIDDQLEASQIACFVGDRYLLTLHDGADRLLGQARTRWERERDELPGGIAYLLYALLDTVVDDYQSIADRLETEIEELEEIVLAAPTAPVQRQVYGLKQQVLRLRRYALPLRRVLDWMVEGEGRASFGDDATELLRDVHDHILRIAEQVANVDDLSGAVLDLSRSAQAHALNEINKKLSAWAAIFAVSAIITGAYGMNYRLFPNLDGQIGFGFAVALMAVSAGSLYAYFRRKGWL
ncbi:MAG: magnesium transporter CorA family protein [Actinomycetota bacterium]